MPVYRTEFERVNFDFDPPLYQKADVVFQTDVPYDDDHLGDFEAAAWDAMWTQNPHWKDPSSPLEGYAGWSSVLGGRKYEEVTDKDLDFDLGEPGIGLPRIAETFKRKSEIEKERNSWDNSYRVTGFYKTYVPKKSEPETPEEKLSAEIIDKILAEEDAKLTQEERERKAKRIKVVSCSRDEAEFISGAGVGGCIAPLDDVIVTGRVNWEDRTIARHRRDHNKRLEREQADMPWPTEIYAYWLD